MNTISDAVTYLQEFFARYEQLPESFSFREEEKNELSEELKEYVRWGIEEEVMLTDEQYAQAETMWAWTPQESDQFFTSVLWQERYTALLNEWTTDFLNQVIDREYTLPST